MKRAARPGSALVSAGAGTQRELGRSERITAAEDLAAEPTDMVRRVDKGGRWGSTSPFSCPSPAGPASRAAQNAQLLKCE